MIAYTETEAALAWARLKLAVLVGFGGDGEDRRRARLEVVEFGRRVRAEQADTRADRDRNLQ